MNEAENDEIFQKQWTYQPTRPYSISQKLPAIIKPPLHILVISSATDQNKDLS